MTAFLQELKERQYKIYVTDALKALTENTARFAGGTVFKERWIDLHNREPQEEKTAEQIVDDVVTRAGLTLINEGGE